MIFDHGSVATYLKEVLDERAARTRGYSLRTLARDLDVSPAHLSQIMSRKKKISPRMRLKIAGQLGLDQRSTRYFYLLAQLETVPLGDMRASTLKEMGDLRHQVAEQPLASDQFELLSDWYNLPIVEMTYLTDFRCTEERVSDRLGITRAQAASALDRLQRAGILERSDDGAFRRIDPRYVVRTSRPDEAYASFLRQMMTLALDAMEQQPIAERLMMSQTFSIAREQLPEARQITREYMQRMASLYEAAPRREHTYQLNVQFFSLTDGRRKGPRRDQP